MGSFLVVAKSSPLRIFAHKRSETHIYKHTDKKKDRKSVFQCWMYIVVKTHITKYMLSVYEYSCFCNWLLNKTLPQIFIAKLYTVLRLRNPMSYFIQIPSLLPALKPGKSDFFQIFPNKSTIYNFLILVLYFLRQNSKISNRFGVR